MKSSFDAQWLLCLGGAALVWGCGVGSLDAAADEARGTGKAQQAVVSHWSAYHGGGGGEAFESPAGANMRLYAARFKCGWYVDWVYFRGQQSFGFGPYGAGYGGTWMEVSCGGEGTIAGVKGRSGAWIDQLTIVCRRNDGSTYDLPTCGSSQGGEPFEEICEPWMSMVAIKGRAGSWLDGVSIGCGWSDIPG